MAVSRRSMVRALRRRAASAAYAATVAGAAGRLGSSRPWQNFSKSAQSCHFSSIRKTDKDQRQVVYANRQRLQRPKGKRLLRKRGELIERTFAHCYDTGGMRRTHLRKHNNILKRLLIHVAGMNLGLLLRNLYGVGTPRSLQGLWFTLRFFAAMVAALLYPQNCS